jgi:signal peptidase I
VKLSELFWLKLKPPCDAPIRLVEMDFTRQFSVKTTALLLYAFIGAGCVSEAGKGLAAPRSNLTRSNALTLAKMVAANVHGQVYVVAPTGSMRPTLDEGSIVTIEKVNWDKLQTGDIVIYRSTSGSAVIHRLYERHDQGWFVLGDNNVSIDRETVTSNNLLGRVCAIIYTAATPSPSRDAALTAGFVALAGTN